MSFIIKNIKLDFENIGLSNSSPLKLAGINHLSPLNKAALDWYGEEENKFQARELVLYLPGLITHAISFPFHIIMSITYLISSILLSLAVGLSFGQIKSLNELTKNFWIVTGSGVSTIGTDTIGIVCPPVAYRLNHLAYDYFSKKLGANHDVIIDFLVQKH